MDVWKKNTIFFFIFFLGSNADQRRGSWELEHVCWKSSHQLRRGFDQKPRRALSPWHVPVWLCETSWQLWYHEHTPSEQNVHPFVLFYHCPHSALVSLLKWVGRQRIRTSDQHCRHPGKLVLPRYTPGVSDIQKHHWCLSVVSSSAPLPQKRTLSLSKTRNSKVNVKLQQKLLIYFSCNV